MQVALVARYSILLNFHFHPLKCQPPSSVYHWTSVLWSLNFCKLKGHKHFIHNRNVRTNRINQLSSPPFLDPSTPINNLTNSSSNPTISSKSSSGFKKKSMPDQLIKNCKFKKEAENKEEREWNKESREEKQATSTSSNLIRRFELVWLALTSYAPLFFFANRNWNGFEDLWD